MSIDPTEPFKMYKVGFPAFKSPPILNAFGWLCALKSPYINACRVNSKTQYSTISKVKWTLIVSMFTPKLSTALATCLLGIRFWLLFLLPVIFSMLWSLPSCRGDSWGFVVLGKVWSTRWNLFGRYRKLGKIEYDQRFISWATRFVILMIWWLQRVLMI